MDRGMDGWTEGLRESTGRSWPPAPTGGRRRHSALAAASPAPSAAYVTPTALICHRCHRHSHRHRHCRTSTRFQVRRSRPRGQLRRPQHPSVAKHGDFKLIAGVPEDVFIFHSKLGLRRYAVDTLLILAAVAGVAAKRKAKKYKLRRR